MKMSDQKDFQIARYHKVFPIWFFAILMSTLLFLGHMEHRPARAESSGDTSECNSGKRDNGNVLQWLGGDPHCTDNEKNTVTLNNVTIVRELLWSLQLAIAPEVVDFIPMYSYSCSQDDACQDVVEKLTKEFEKMHVTSDWYVGVARNFGNADSIDIRAWPLSDEEMQDIVSKNQIEGIPNTNDPLYIVSSKPISGVGECSKLEGCSKLWASADNKKVRWNPAIVAPRQ